MSTCGSVVTSTCCCRNSALPRPRVDVFTVANSASGTVGAIAFVSASTRKYSSSMPKRNAPASGGDSARILVLCSPSMPMLSPPRPCPHGRVSKIRGYPREDVFTGVNAHLYVALSARKPAEHRSLPREVTCAPSSCDAILHRSGVGVAWSPRAALGKGVDVLTDGNIPSVLVNIAATSPRESRRPPRLRSQKPQPRSGRARRRASAKGRSCRSRPASPAGGSRALREQSRRPERPCDPRANNPPPTRTRCRAPDRVPTDWARKNPPQPSGGETRPAPRRLSDSETCRRSSPAPW
jgi:hypothetical protein